MFTSIKLDIDEFIAKGTEAGAILVDLVFTVNADVERESRRQVLRGFDVDAQRNGA